MKNSRGLSWKFMLYALLSIVMSLIGLFIIFWIIIYVFQTPGTIDYFYNAFIAVDIIFRYTPWMIWLGIFVGLFALIFYLLSRNTIHRLDNISSAVNQVAKGKYNLYLPTKNNDNIGVLEKEINEMARNVEHAMLTQKATEQSKDDFIKNIAHDIRTPLMSIIGYLTFIRENKLDLETTQKYASIAYEKSRRMERLIEDLFDISYLMMTELQIDKSDIQLEKFLLQVQDEAFPILQDAGMELRIDFGDEKFGISADGDLLSRVFDNLITNAVRYATEGKYIDINVQRKECGALLSVLTYANPIPDTELENIFGKLYRLEKSRSSETGGSGLGLSISRRIIELHNGTLTARRTEKGTAFDIWLPYAY